MLHSVIQQFLRSVDWGELDYLVIDLPPGTGDVQISLMQTAPITGAVIVTTPSEVSLEDARKSIHMFNQVRVPVLGVVENMSYLISPGSGERIDVFGMGGGKKMALTMGVQFLGELALDPAVRTAGDSGAPIALKGAGDSQSKGFFALADALQARVAQSGGPKSPTMTMED